MTCGVPEGASSNRGLPLKQQHGTIHVDGDRERLWSAVSIGAPEGAFVPEGVAGTGYVSPGYGG